jgi:hypothetical protein
MIDLEQEFEQLRSSVIKQINDKIESGELSAEEGGRLTEMVYARMVVSTLPEEDRCPDGHAGDCGWSPSMGYHCY